MSTTQAAPAETLPVAVTPRKARSNRANNPVNPAIITEEKALLAFNYETAQLYQTVSTRVHIAVISSLWFAAVHGRTEPLDVIFNALDTNHKSAVKLYVRRYSAELGLGRSPDGASPLEVQEAVKAARFLKHSTKPDEKSGRNWTMISGRAKQRKEWVKLINSRLAKPDNKVDFPVLYRNNFSEQRKLYDADALKAIQAATKRILQPSENVDVMASDKVLKFVQKIHDEVDQAMATMLPGNTNA